ncbi:hypothetical protein PN36_21235 [Candidatus Thiomargarita nelsonii]|uniref:DUF2169 domain-containing protein n=1 Tax=Candidatus Thiomargarita nelsonii TaxID=1003181 RepID=A0A0A6PKB6_9GAMM|nr:hypothetical protein PN36_21235 [Candidatus Thiomargarita nelsonii]
MWQLQNMTPFAAERAFVRDKNGAEVWVVAVKASFTINPDGSTSIAEEQPEVCNAPKYRGDPTTSSLLCDSDLVHTKPGTDVILHGHAYAPQGRQIPWTDIEMRLGSVVKKRLRVFGDRYWEKGTLNMTEPELFEKMPIIYERAFGGIDATRQFMEPRNPVGTGFAVKTEHIIGQRVANIEDPANLITSWKQRPQPVGFTPIAGHWLPRLKFAGTYDTKWEKTRQPLLPNDFDERFYHCAPPDQQVKGYLKGGEPVELYNLSPNGQLRFQLPQMSLGFKTFFGAKTEEHEAQLHSVIIKPDVPQVSLVWQTHLNCHNRDSQLEKTVVFQKKS